MGISLAMIVKNEAQTIERTIKSVSDYVDEIVVGLDTKSTDHTKELLEGLAHKVLPIHLSEELAAKGSVDGEPGWGFDKARNKVFDHCNPQNWRLVLDGHEVLQSPERMALAVMDAIIKGAEGVEVKVNFEPDENNIPQTFFASTRIMAPHVKYANSIHNVPQTPKGIFQDHQIIVEHRKMDQNVKDKTARDVQRSEANIEGLLKKAKENGNHARTWYYLATAYKENGRYQEAIDTYEECLKYSVWNEERWHSHYNAGVCCRALGQWQKAHEHFMDAIEDFPVMAEAYYQLGDIAYKTQRYRTAKLWLEKCAQMPMPQCRLFVDARLYMVDRYDSLSMVYHHLQEFEKAIEYAQKALDAAPNERVQKNVDIWQRHIA